MGVVKVLGERLSGTLKSPIYDLDYERNCRFFHYFLNIRGDSEKIGDFLHYFFLPSSPVQFSLLDAVTR